MKHLSLILIVMSFSLLSLNSFAKGPKAKLYVIYNSHGNKGGPVDSLSMSAMKALKANKKIKAAFDISRIETKQLKDHPLTARDQAVIVLRNARLDPSDVSPLREYISDENASQVAWYSNSTGSCKLISTNEKEPIWTIVKAHPKMNCFEAIGGYIPHLLSK